MSNRDEVKRLASKLSDRSRKVVPTGSTAIVPHKVKETGELISEDTFDATVDISKLSLPDLRFLEAWREAGWNLEKACTKLGLDIEKGKRIYKKVRYFEFEDAKIKALSKVPTPEFVTAKNLEGFITDKMSDGQRDHLKELAKITGAYKPTNQISLTQNVFNLPKLSPEVEAKFKELAERALDAEEVHDVA